MASTNTKRFWINLVLLTAIGGLVFFVINHKEESGELYKTLYDKSIGDNAKEIIIHAEGKDDIVIQHNEKENIWMVVKPAKFIADKEKIRHLFTLLSENAETSYDINTDLKGKSLAHYGLDEERLSISFNGVKLIFGKFNDITNQRFILKGNRMYLISETIASLLSAGAEGFKSKPKPALTTKPKS